MINIDDRIIEAVGMPFHDGISTPSTVMIYAVDDGEYELLARLRLTNDGFARLRNYWDTGIPVDSMSAWQNGAIYVELPDGLEQSVHSMNELFGTKKGDTCLANGQSNIRYMHSNYSPVLKTPPPYPIEFG